MVENNDFSDRNYWIQQDYNMCPHMFYICLIRICIIYIFYNMYITTNRSIYVYVCVAELLYSYTKYVFQKMKKKQSR